MIGKTSYIELDKVNGFKRVIVIAYSPEISLKGKNRGEFVSVLKHNLVSRLKTLTNNFKLVKNSSRFLVYLSDEVWSDESMIRRIVRLIRSTFGVSSVSLAYKSDLDIESMRKIALHLFSYFYSSYTNINSFKISASRSNKSYSLKSPQINEAVASRILDFINEEKLPVNVNLKHPDLTIYIEVLNNLALVFVEKINSVGGLPLFIQGEILFDLKGLTEQTINTFVLSAFLTLRRGIKPLFINYEEVDKNILNNFEERLSLFLLPNKLNFIDSHTHNPALSSHLLVESTLDFPNEFSSSQFVFPLLSDESFLNKKKELMEELIDG